MGFVGSLLGTSGGAGGTGFASPQQTQLQTPVTNEQANTAYGNAQTGLTNQQNFLNAVNPGSLAALASQQQLLQQLQQGAQGYGPNPALAQLAQTTGQNTANQAALMAGQRGSNQNAGLIARQAAQQGAQNQQNAIGQAATLSAQQQLAQQQALAQQQQAMIGQQQSATNNYATSAQNEQANLLNSIASANNARTASQGNVNSANAALAGTQMQGQQNMLGNATQGFGSAIMSAFADGGEIDPNGGVHVDSAPTTSAVSIPTVQNSSQKSGGGGGGGGLGALLALMKDGGAVPQNMPQMYANGGQQPFNINPMAQLPSNGPQSNIGQYFAAQATPATKVEAGSTPAASSSNIPSIRDAFSHLFDPSSGKSGDATHRSDEQTQQDYLDADRALSQPGPAQETEMPASNMDAMAAFAAAHGGKVPVLLSPGEKVLKPSQAKAGANPMKDGATVPGKPKVGGAKNSYANDTYATQLEPGSIVIPRSVTQGKNAERKAQEFVAAVLRNGGKPPKKGK